MNHSSRSEFIKYIYWVEGNDYADVKKMLTDEGVKIGKVLMTPCEVLKASGNKVLVAAPWLWSFICKRQGSWYRNSDKSGKYMLASANRLSGQLDKYLDVTLTETRFAPDELPTDSELEKLIASDEYNSDKPEEWEQKGIKDAVLFKVLFTLTGFWGWGDNLKKYWLSHKANHANYLCQTYTTKIEGKDVPYSVAENKGICSSCVQFFNVMSNNSQKLVRACPGAVTFGSTKRTVFYNVQPVKK